jgi:hypothetical protein
MSLRNEGLRTAWRLFTLATALHLAVGVGVCAAQIVLVRNAPAGSTVELVFNADTLASATADTAGEATLTVPGETGKAEMDAYIFVDLCGDDLRRVLLVERGVQAPPPGACARREIPGLFLVRRVSTLVIDAGKPNPTVLLRQGPYDPRAAAAAREWSQAPRGLVLFGGAGLSKTRDFRPIACGNVAQCTADDITATYTAGAAVWITSFLGAEAAYVRAGDTTAEGSGENYRFNSFFDRRLITVAGLLGVPIGPVRLYGKAGANFHRGTFHTSQTMDEVTIIIDDVPHTAEGGDLTYELRTEGWSWLFGAGIEAWVARSLALYAEGGRAALKGPAVDDAEGAADERVTSFMFGVRIRIGR